MQATGYFTIHYTAELGSPITKYKIKILHSLFRQNSSWLFVTNPFYQQHEHEALYQVSLNTMVTGNGQCIVAISCPICSH